jgi:para-aminobenzoate synthetase component 1
MFRGGSEVLVEAQRWLAQFRGEPASAALLIGSLAYELGHELAGGRSAAREASGLPAVELCGFRAAYVFDEERRRGQVCGGSPHAVAALRARLEDARSHTERACRDTLPRLGSAKRRTSDSEFLAAVRRVKEYIRAGDVYQVNLARRLDAPAPGERGLRALFTSLARATAAPFSAYLESPERAILSSSPERFLRVAGGEVETCPIKGTRPRGASAAEDTRLLAELVASAKDRAEHVMIVDLERNDLGRVCRTGSVRVAELCTPQSFSDVHHLVSSVRGQLRDPWDWPELLRATFPGGSITGAPKLRAMQIAAELEPVARDVYTGALGYFDAAGGGDWSIAIRTAVAARGELHLHLGGGIVADSDPERELQETRDKGRGFARSWGLQV